MDFELSDDQVALRDAAARLLGDHATSERIRAADGFDRTLWEALVAQGWLGTEVPQRDGGLGLGFVEVVVLAEQAGRHAAPVPFVETVLAMGALAGSTVDEAHAWAGRLARGDAVGCVVAAGAPAIYAPDADVAVLSTGDALGLVDLAAAGRPPREPAMELTRTLGWLGAERAAVEIGDRADAERLADRAAVAYAADLLGGAGTVLDMAVAYAKERVQFGKPIGSFQAVKHRCANMLVDVEAMRSTVYHAAWCVANETPDASIAASTAKTWCADAARRVMSSGLQVHGGIGFTWEHDLHLHLKRSQLSQVSWGDATHHRDRLATRLRALVEAGASLV